jgi:hypothetical protein
MKRIIWEILKLPDGSTRQILATLNMSAYSGHGPGSNIERQVRVLSCTHHSERKSYFKLRLPLFQTSLTLEYSNLHNVNYN